MAKKCCDDVVAVDTNVLVRLLTGDDPKQTDAARALFTRDSIWIAKTVLLETNWVLRKLYRFDQNGIREAFRAVLGLENVHVEDEPAVVASLALTERGLELADALHLLSRPSGAAFASFDQALIQRARRAGVSDLSGVSI